ncbi:hypothetical protein ABZ322_06915 [Streptomyces sp. NPDC006129]|uniref:ApeA N-terminal domain 1-containing protein n=1 Tax=Streptomyces sp. NPDC006129 TaxID=3155348 RepID=UPI0033B9471F
MPDDSRAFEVQGKWWLPEHKDHEVSGTLSYSPETGSELRLIGALFAARGSYRMPEDGVYGRIHGHAGGREFTLEDCFQTRYGLATGSETEVIHVQQIYKGVWFTEEDEPNTDRVTVDMRYLTHWVGHLGISGTHSFKSTGPGEVIASLQAMSQPDLTLTIRDDISLKFHHLIGHSRSKRLEQSISERYVCVFEFPHVVPTTLALEYVSDLQDLISIATGRFAEFDRVSFSLPQVPKESGDGASRVPFDFYAQWTVRDKSKKPGERHPSQMLFTFDDLGGEAGVARWLECANRHRSTLGRVMASRYQPGLFAADRLFHRVAAIEAFGRKRIGVKTVKLPGALKHCCELAGDDFTTLVGDAAGWSTIVKSNRDDLGHHYDRRPDQGGSAQYFLAESTYWLFVLCMLRDIAAPQAVFDRIKESPDWAWLGPKVRAVVKAG